MAVVPGMIRAAAEDYEVLAITDLTPDGVGSSAAGPLDWSADGQWIAYDIRGADFYSDVYRMHPDGTGKEGLTTNHPSLPNRHIGNSDWHPGGRWLLFQAEKSWHTNDGQHFPCRPGGGFYNDLYVMDLNSAAPYDVYQLNDVRSNLPAGGSLHPHFNQDGSKVIWGDLQNYEGNFGNWRIADADFVTSSIPPLLTNICYFEPATVDLWYETHGWGPENMWIYFSGMDKTGMSENAADICRMNMADTNHVIRLTFSSGMDGEPAAWDEHAQLSPQNDVFAFMSSYPSPIETNASYWEWLKTDMWLMNTNGTGHRRATYFNEYLGHTICADNSWDPTGTRLAVCVNTLDASNVYVKIIDFYRRPEINNIVSASNAMLVSFAAVTGRSYKLQSTTSLLNPDWRDAGQVVTASASTVITLMDTNLQFTNIFYRVVPGNLPSADMAFVPAGHFSLGVPDYTGRNVFVSAFFIDQQEVTKALWDGVRNWAVTNGYSDLAAGDGGWRETPPGSPGVTNHPVVNINWYDAVKWCNARSEKECLVPVYYTNTTQTAVFRVGTNDLTIETVKWSACGYRLPTEAEWEKAARGGLTNSSYPWGEVLDGSKANYYNSGDPYDNGTTPVRYYHGGQQTNGVPCGTDMANGWGLYDKAGNVQELCWDRWSTSPPAAGWSDPRGPTNGTSRVARGGSWNADTNGLKCSARSSASPTNAGPDIGLSCVRGFYRHE